MIQLLNSLLVKILYRRTVYGAEKIPKEGGALLVANHIAWSDPSLILSTTKRTIRFLMYRPFFNLPVIGYFARASGAIPIAQEDGPKSIVKSLSAARDAIAKGELVGIFAEGELTRIGNLLPFSRGYEKIMKGLSAPIVPAHIDALWGSFFSFRGGRPVRKMPRKFPYPVTLSFGDPLPPTTPAWKLREVIQDLATDAFATRLTSSEGLAREIVRALRTSPFTTAITDSTGVTLSRGLLVAVSIALRNQMQGATTGENIGILLPASAGGAIANIATLFAGKTPVNLNFTLAQEVLDGARTQAAITTVISSRKFLEKLTITVPGTVLFIEDLLAAAQGSFLAKASLFSTVAALTLLPSTLFSALYSIPRMAKDALATVLFSSGSTGTPKGVMLSHGNITANIIGLSDVLHLTKNDCMIGSLPFFHSFGFTATLWLPLLTGVKVVYHPNPLDGSTIGKLALAHRATLLLSTPTFLQTYMRKCTKEQFASLRLAVVGAEKLKQPLAEAFKEQFGVQPLEGYGCTELSPVAAVNVPNYADHAVNQTGTKPDSVGHPLPGISARIVDPDTGTPLPPGEPGLLLIRGANVMLGYLGNEKATKEVLRDGWYVTGDIAKLDEDGFIYITDRLSRFSKIGGEMVPHIKVEEALLAALGTTDQVCVVTAVPHESKGEQLVVLHTIDLESTAINKKLVEAGLPNIWIPKRESYIKVDTIPVLGTGKIDLKQVKKVALAATTTATTAEIVEK